MAAEVLTLCLRVCAGTIIEVNVSELGLVTPAGKVVWGKYAQVRCGLLLPAASTTATSAMNHHRYLVVATVCLSTTG